MKKKLILSSLALSSGALFAAGEYFFKYAMTPYNKETDSKELSVDDPLYEEKLWYKNFHKKKWQLEAEPGLTLSAKYLDHHCQRTAILLHGFMSDGDSMAAFAKMFYDLGFNILLPDARAHGLSQGKYIGYGWVEKQDVLKWIEQVIEQTGKDAQIVVMGQSMGGATTMMVSGMHLPRQVKAFIEDCGYSSVAKEIDYQAQRQFKLPTALRVPVIKMVSVINKLKNNFFLNDASSVKQLRQNVRPFLFIHGGKDDFVPTAMVYENYSASQGPKKLWIAPLAGHALSYPMYKKQYQQEVKDFLKKYIN